MAKARGALPPPYTSHNPWARAGGVRSPASPALDLDPTLNPLRRSSSTVRALVLCLMACAAAGPAASASPQSGKGRAPKEQAPADAVEAARRWAASAQRARENLDQESLARLQPILADLRVLMASQPDRRADAAVALLEICALAPHASGVPSSYAAALEQASASAYEALGRGLDLDHDGLLAAAVAAQCGDDDPKRPLERRRAALEALRERQAPSTLAALAAATADPRREIRDGAAACLLGWDAEPAHRALIALWVRLRSDPKWVRAQTLERHFATVRLGFESPLESALFGALSGDLLSPDWRATVRALRASEALSNERAVPVLIESLGSWIARRPSANNGPANQPNRPKVQLWSARIENEFVLALQRRSGKRIGPYPDRWARWWKNAQDDQGPTGPEGPPQASRAGFYGLRPVTDRVCFVIDRSGSMANGAPDGEGSRFRQALGQFERFVRELGPGARFRVVLFSDGVQVWRDTLSPATPAALSEALTWAGYQKPGGGTELRPAIENVLRLDRAGNPNLERLEEDTVIVLCDGATAEGAGWVAPLLDRVGAASAVAFHCVQLGSGGGDGALRLLAELSGGEYVETDG